MKHGADPGIPDKSGRSSLMYACALGREELVKLLLTHNGFDMNASDCEGNTALFYSVLQGNEKITEAVLDALNMYNIKGADKTNRKGETPLIKASKLGHMKCAEMLLTKGKASTKARDFEHRLTAEEWKRSVKRLSLKTVSETKTFFEKLEKKRIPQVNMKPSWKRDCFIHQQRAFTKPNPHQTTHLQDTMTLKSNSKTLLWERALEKENHSPKSLDEMSSGERVKMNEKLHHQTSKVALTQLMEYLSQDSSSSYRPSCKPLHHLPRSCQEGEKERNERSQQALRLWRISRVAITFLTLNRHPKLFSKKDFSLLQGKNIEWLLRNKTKYNQFMGDSKRPMTKKSAPRELWRRTVKKSSTTKSVVNLKDGETPLKPVKEKKLSIAEISKLKTSMDSSQPKAKVMTWAKTKCLISQGKLSQNASGVRRSKLQTISRKPTPEDWETDQTYTSTSLLTSSMTKGKKEVLREEANIAT